MHAAAAGMRAPASSGSGQPLNQTSVACQCGLPAPPSDQPRLPNLAGTCLLQTRSRRLEVQPPCIARPKRQFPPTHFRRSRTELTAVQTTIKTLAVIKPTRDLRTRLMGASAGMDDAETKDLNLFVDLLEQCLALNPDKRIKPTEALRHPFFTARAVKK